MSLRPRPRRDRPCPRLTVVCPDFRDGLWNLSIRRRDLERQEERLYRDCQGQRPPTLQKSKSSSERITHRVPATNCIGDTLRLRGDGLSCGARSSRSGDADVVAGPYVIAFWDPDTPRRGRTRPRAHTVEVPHGRGSTVWTSGVSSREGLPPETGQLAHRYHGRVPDYLDPRDGSTGLSVSRAGPGLPLRHGPRKRSVGTRKERETSVEAEVPFHAY